MNGNGNGIRSYQRVFSFFFVLCRVLCETVKDFVSKVGTASANSEPWQAEEPDSLTQKVQKKCTCTKNKTLECVVISLMTDSSRYLEKHQGAPNWR